MRFVILCTLIHAASVSFECKAFAQTHLFVQGASARQEPVTTTKGAAWQSVKPEKRRASGKKYYLMGNGSARTDPQRAISHYQEAIKNGYDTNDLRVEMGRLLRSVGRLQEAAEQFRVVIRRDADNLRAHLGLAYTSGSIGQHEEALKEFGEVKRLDPRSYGEGIFAPDVAQSLDALGRYKEALAEYEAALRCRCHGESADENFKRRVQAIKEKLSHTQ